MNDPECKEIIEVAEGPSVCGDEPSWKYPAAMRKEAGYGIKVWLEKPYEQVVSSIRASLAGEGLTVITEIDASRVFHEKLGIEYPNYLILGVCAPELAHRALEHDKDLGLLLPCNVVVYEDGKGTILEAIDPLALLALADREGLRDIALTVKHKLQDAIDHVAAGVF